VGGGWNKFDCMLKTIFKLHADIQENEMDKIIALKSIFWQYSYESQINWLKNNLQNNDLHMMIIDNEELIAYLNLVKIQLTINGANFHAIGIGNVCTVQTGKGYGSVLMAELNNYLLVNHLIGALFCHSELERFYAKFCWQKISIIHKENRSNVMMIFNFNPPIFDANYDGKLF
jgi:hypothetical protein